MGGKSSDPPPAPDYGQLAQEQGAANTAAALATAKANNPNYVNPYGSQDVVWNDGQPTITQNLSPEQQGLYDQNLQTQGLLAGIGTQGAQALDGVIGNKVDFSGAPNAPGDSQATRDSVINAMMGRVNTDTDNRRDQVNSDLIARGIRPGTEAYNTEMDQIDRGFNDARQQAITAGGAEAQRDFNMDTESRRNYIGELLTKRQTPLNEINALQNGSQVSNPFAVGGFNSGANIAPAPTFAAGQAGYNGQLDAFNAQQAGGSNFMSGLMGLGGSLGSAAIMACWVAREVYGEDNPQWMMFRQWLYIDAPRWLFKVYMKYGERFAAWLKGKDKLKSLIMSWMDARVKNGLR